MVHFLEKFKMISDEKTLVPCQELHHDPLCVITRGGLHPHNFFPFFTCIIPQLIEENQSQREKQEYHHLHSQI